jgi:hypothetical protein
MGFQEEIKEINSKQSKILLKDLKDGMVITPFNY